MALAIPFVNGASLAVQQPTPFNLQPLGSLVNLIVAEADKRRAEQLALEKQAHDDAQTMALEGMRVSQQRASDAAAQARQDDQQRMQLELAGQSDKAALDRLDHEYALRTGQSIIEQGLKNQGNLYDLDYGSGGSTPPAAGDATRGVATTFGYNDKEDNGLGAWGDVTNDPDVMGVSLPIDYLKSHFGDENLAHGKLVEVTNPVTGKTITAPILDKGPAKWVEQREGQPVIDLTHAANLALGGDGKTAMQWRILDHPASQGPLSALNLTAEGAASPNAMIPHQRGAVITPPPAPVAPPPTATPQPDPAHWAPGYSGPYVKSIPVAGSPGTVMVQQRDGTVRFLTSSAPIVSGDAGGAAPSVDAASGLPIAKVTVDAKGLRHLTYAPPTGAKPGGSSPLDKALATKTANEIVDSEGKGASLQGALTAVKTLLDDPKFQTGPWAGRAGAVGQFVNEDYASKRQEFEAASNALAMAMRQAGTGSMSDKDLAFLVAQAPSVNKTREANRAIISRLELAQEALMDRNQYVTRRSQEGVSLAKAREEYAAYAQANPIFQRDASGAITKAPRPTIDQWMTSGKPPSASATTAGAQPQGTASFSAGGTISAAQASQLMGQPVFPGATIRDKTGKTLTVTQ